MSRKVHRFGFGNQGKRRQMRYRIQLACDSRTMTKPACGTLLYPGTPNCGYAVCDRLFKTLPVDRRCRTCESKWMHLLASPKEAIEYLAIGEVLVLSLARLGEQMAGARWPLEHPRRRPSRRQAGERDHRRTSRT